MQLSMPQPPQERRKTDYLTIAQVVVSGLGMLFSFLSAAFLGVMGLISLFGETSQAETILPVFASAWISLLVAFLTLPSILLGVLRWMNRPVFPWLARFLSGGFRVASLLLLLWPLVLLLGNLLSRETTLAWLLLPPLQILVAGIPTLWLIAFASRGLFSGSPQRRWGLLNFSILITTPLLMFLEIIGFIVLLVVFAIWAGTQPAVVDALQQIGEQLAISQPDPEMILSILAPYMANPWVIFGALALVAGLVPLTEELVKPLAIWLLAGHKLSPAEGFVAGALCGAGFALVESLFYLSNPAGDGWLLLAFGRTGTLLLHITTTALVGRAMAAAMRDRTYLQLGLTYLLAALLHGAWNGLAVLTGFASALQQSSGSLQLGYNIANAAPVVLSILALLLFILLWNGNRSLRLQNRSLSGTNPVEGPLETKL